MTWLVPLIRDHLLHAEATVASDDEHDNLRNVILTELRTLGLFEDESQKGPAVTVSPQQHLFAIDRVRR